MHTHVAARCIAASLSSAQPSNVPSAAIAPLLVIPPPPTPPTTAHSGSDKSTYLERHNRHRQRTASRGHVDRPADAQRPAPPAQREALGQRHLPPRPRQTATDEAVLPGPPKRHPPRPRVHVHAQRQLGHRKGEENLAQLQPRRWLDVPLNGLAKGDKGRVHRGRGWTGVRGCARGGTEVSGRKV